MIKQNRPLATDILHSFKMEIVALRILLAISIITNVIIYAIK